ncbi:A/G-specific DNA-adenine glycosylase [Agreia bicolorata]|uniref:Adenine DNA glycosylase n=1 Tax=Agreia bicolorata TaxID=110935 RepID=A0A1T4XAL1_9MICO|nr:A/G-specific DNA-adenine glycosylase [Agreia bicolorata]
MTTNAPPIGSPGAAATSDYARALIEWFETSARDLPWRAPGFGAWGILVSEFMLQQTPVARVIPRLEEWLERWPNPEALAADSPGEAVRAWQSLGYPRRALWLHACAVAITEEHGGIVPSDVEALRALPGIGDYTSRAVAVFAYGDRHPVVDTNTRRVIARSVEGRDDAGPPSARRDLDAMDRLLPHDELDARSFNAAIMELGAVVCTARRPECDICPIRTSCAWLRAGFPETGGPKKKVQKKFEGSDRQVRGLVLALLRASEGAHGVPIGAVDTVWHDRGQLERAVDGLLADGLLTRTPDGFALPS